MQLFVYGIKVESVAFKILDDPQGHDRWTRDPTVGVLDVEEQGPDTRGINAGHRLSLWYEANPSPIYLDIDFRYRRLCRSFILMGRVERFATVVPTGNYLPQPRCLIRSGTVGECGLNVTDFPVGATTFVVGMVILRQKI